MTFWGIEVKPGKPFTFNAEDLSGKLILTQATLGTGSATKKSILQVNVGDKSPVYLCTLLPDKTESCSLNLEFDEDDDVKFSVVGPTSIHLSGFVQGDVEHECDSDSCGEDISETDSGSSEYDSEDGLGDDFVDDDDVPIFPPSPVRKSGVVIEEIVDDEKAATENGGTKKGKKKKQLGDSDNEKRAEQQIVVKGDIVASVLESEDEDEDGFPVSSSRKSEANSENSKANTTTIADEGKKKKIKKDKAKHEDESSKSLKRKVDAINHEQKSDATEAADGDASENKKKKKQKKKKKGKTEDDEEGANLKQDAPEDKQIHKTDKEAKKSTAKVARVRNFPNGLVIEDISMGKPDGKRASRGSKVSVHYTGKLQKNGKQFDSNVGRKPFKFRLGIGSVIKGWDIGLEGMRVGDKRRLTIPPAMGYGASGAPPQIPPNAWLVFDVELADVA
ncbi:hypothetical protein BVRB_3g055630 [Beta vulgaris subsp. vulgaris]|uniref:FK506-binding protein n=1 Tax=Beta vulgaris subsp. vulgaris TaxID=3555 RepID=A0A0J8CQ30_BETVV|nr:hypothetical protein BVRB_3g055630 [Beta vulgaris subsp. vulgaris]